MGSSTYARKSTSAKPSSRTPLHDDVEGVVRGLAPTRRRTGSGVGTIAAEISTRSLAVGGSHTIHRPQATRVFLMMLAYALLMAYGVYLRVPGLDPVGFRNDDNWLSIVIRKMSWDEFFWIRPPVPIAFRFIQDLVSNVSIDPEWPLQVVPVAASVLQALFAGILVTHICNDRWIGLVAAAGGLVSPAWIELGVRPKQYATDGLVTVVMVLLAVRVWHDPTRVRVMGFLAGCVGALALSFPAVFTIAPALAVTLFMPRTRRAFLRRESRMPFLLALTAIWRTAPTRESIRIMRFSCPVQTPRRPRP